MPPYGNEKWKVKNAKCKIIRDMALPGCISVTVPEIPTGQEHNLYPTVFLS